MKKVYSLLLIAVLSASCKQANRQTEKNGDKPVITVTIEPLRYFTEAVAGDRFTVVSMVPKGTSPETYEQGGTLLSLCLERRTGIAR